MTSMNTQTAQREILLFTETSFAKKELCETDKTGNHVTKNPAEQLEKACWSGLIFEMFPGIFNSQDQKNMYVWKINKAEQFIHVLLGTAPCSIEHETSIDPYFFRPRLGPEYHELQFSG